MLTPVPIILFRRKWGPREGRIIAASVLASILALMVIFSAFQLLPLFLIYGSVGLFFGEAVERDLPLEASFALVVAAAAIITLAGLLLASGLSPGQAAVAVKKTVGESIVMVNETLKEIRPDAGYSKAQLDGFTDTAVRVLPALFINSLLIVVWFNLLVMRKLAARYGMREYPSFELNLWRMPDFAVWPAIAAGFSVWLGKGALWILGMNALAILTILYFFHGLAIVAYYFKKWKVPPLFRFLLYALVVIYQHFLVAGLALVGLFDTWFDFRRLKASSSGGGGSENSGGM
jgi:uncharacterized protein YybS (DUF2232 family)